MGSAAAFVIDTSEEFSFAQGIFTNGDVYRALINLCNNKEKQGAKTEEQGLSFFV
ncbi:MAG: hypothetical protein ACI30A_04280 [Paludibacteraceae bacterium]